MVWLVGWLGSTFVLVLCLAVILVRCARFLLAYGMFKCLLCCFVWVVVFAWNYLSLRLADRFRLLCCFDVFIGAVGLC